MDGKELIEELYDRIWQLEKEKMDLNELTDQELKKITNYTGTKYDVQLQLNDSAYSLIQDLLSEIEYRDQIIQEMKEDIEYNYRPRFNNPYEEYGISQKDFI